MKSFIVLSVLLAVASAATPFKPYRPPVAAHHPAPHRSPVAQTYHAGQEIPILRSESNIDTDGHYSYAYETGNGIQASESGIGGQSVQGNAAWTAPDGTPVQFQYVADENGYQPSGALLPTPPPVPEAILRSLEYIRTHPAYNEEGHQLRRPVSAFKPVVQPVYRPQPVKQNPFNRKFKF